MANVTELRNCCLITLFLSASHLSCVKSQERLNQMKITGLKFVPVILQGTPNFSNTQRNKETGFLIETGMKILGK